MSSLSVLPDTSVWVDYLRNGPRGRVEALDGLLASRDAMICGPVIAELLAGVLKPEEPELRLRLAGLPWAELDHEAWQQVGDVSHTLRAAGTPVALTDIEVAVAAVRAGAKMWSFDADFETIAGVLPDLQLFAA